MPTIEDLAALLCQLKDLKRLEYVKCLDDGTICIPNEIPCCAEKTVNLSQSDLLTLLAAGSGDPCCPETNDLLVEILEALQDDIEVGEYTILCSSADPGVTYLAWFEQPDEAGSAIVPMHLVVGVNTPVPGFPPDAIRCPDTKLVQECFYTPGNPDVYYTRVLCLAGTQVLETIWIDASGNVMPAPPAGALPCEGEEHRTVKLKDICASDADGNCETAYLEVVYNQDGSRFSTQTLNALLVPTVYASYTAGPCKLSTIKCYTCI